MGTSNMPFLNQGTEGQKQDGANEDDLLESDKDEDGLNDLLSMTLDEKMSDK